MAEVLPPVLAGGKPADRLLNAHTRANRYLGSRDRAAISALLFGALRWWGWVGRLAPAGVGPLAAGTGPAGEPASWFALMLATERVVDCSLDALRAWLAGQLGVDLSPGPQGDGTDAAADRLRPLLAHIAKNGPPHPLGSVELIPAWLRPLLPEGIGVDRLVDAFQRRAPLWLHVQRGSAADVVAELQREGIECREGPVHGALRLAGSVRLPDIAAYRDGRIEVQDVASQAVTTACGAAQGEAWWDACAGAGGKTLGLAAAVGAQGSVLASDLRHDALQELTTRLVRAGLANVRMRAWDGTERVPGERAFDGVLVDAPCSGTGTWRRNPWLRWTLREGSVGSLAATQLALLRQAARGVREGGVLVYATCSFLEPENTGVVQQFLQESPEFRPAVFPNPLAPDREPRSGWQIWPWDGDGDAMYVARMRRIA